MKHEGNKNVEDFYHIYEHAYKLPSYMLAEWSDEEIQLNNIKILMEYIQNNICDYGCCKPPLKILDVGCGVGELYKQLKNNPRFPDVDYTGIDITKSIVDASKHHNPDAKIIHGDFLKYEFKEKFDVVCALGTFNVGFDAETIREALQKMNKLALNTIFMSISYAEGGDLDYITRDYTYQVNNYGNDKVHADENIILGYAWRKTYPNCKRAY